MVRSGLRAKAAMFFAIILITTLVLHGCRRQKIELQTEYQVVLLSNGSAYFGKIEEMGSCYLLLTDVYYVQGRVNQETKEVTNVLIKRGKEWHAPERMYINVEHVVTIEPVAPDSTVARLIQEQKVQASDLAR